MGSAPFGLYRTRGLDASQRLAAGAGLLLDTPVAEAGVTLFRASCWLPLPTGSVGATALRLAPGALQLRFEPLRFEVGIGNRAWFPSVRTLADGRLHITLAWPATVVRVQAAGGGPRHAIELLRADGDAVAAQATVSGQTGVDLPTPWVGSPLVVDVGEALAGVVLREATLDRIGSLVAGPAGSSTQLAAAPSAITARKPGAAVPGLTLSGVPTSPRLKLLAELPGGATALLWQSLLPGVQTTVLLPAQAINLEWADALAQLLKLGQDAVSPPVLLRLDVESDAPCSATLSQLALVTEAETELLDRPWRADFGGGQAEQQALALTLPAGGSGGQAVVLQGRVVADNQAGVDAAAPAGPARLGALLAQDMVGLQPLALLQPAALAGLALHWQPLSARLQLGLRLLADGASGPATQVVAQAGLDLDTPQAAWLTLRWPAVDLQARRLWVEVTVTAGLGLWLFGSAGGGQATGWTDSRGPRPWRTLLPQALAVSAIGAAVEDAASRPIVVSLGDQTLVSSLPVGPLALSVPQALLPLLATQPLVFTAGVRGSVTVESARLLVRSVG